METAIFDPVKRVLAKAKINFVVTKYFEIRGLLFSHHFAYREHTGDEIVPKP